MDEIGSIFLKRKKNSYKAGFCFVTNILEQCEKKESIQSLKNSIIDWERNYVLKSPMKGYVTLFDVWNRYQNTNAGDVLFTVLPEQKVAIVQDLVYNGVFFAPGVDRANWIAILEELRDDPACDTLLVGHGLPTSRGDLDTAIAYIKVMDDAMTNAATPDEAAAIIKAAFPGYGGEFLLSLIPEYWTR